jgi:hypothetical protein
MKRGTPEHPKTKLLAQLLNVDLSTAVGLLELLWHFTAKYAPQGDIGRYSDKQIAAALHWHRRSGKKGVPTEVRLRSALVQAEFMDTSLHHRLVVHDWNEHADQSVKRMLARRRLSFVQPADSLPEPVPYQSHPSDLLDGENTVTGPPPKKANAPAPNGFDLGATLARLGEIYRRAGVSIPPKHTQLATQLVLSLDPETRARIPQRLPEYCMWALATGRWRDAATTKSLVNVIRDGDWDVEISMRDLPDASRKAPSLADQQTALFLERQARKGHGA